MSGWDGEARAYIDCFDGDRRGRWGDVEVGHCVRASEGGLGVLNKYMIGVKAVATRTVSWVREITHIDYEEIDLLI